jgi:hypothetical protein
LEGVAMTDADDIAAWFGTCPVCSKSGVAHTVGRDRWFVCEEQHRTRWWGGSNWWGSSNLLSAEELATAPEAVATARYLEGFVEVAPYYPKANRDGYRNEL